MNNPMRVNEIPPEIIDNLGIVKNIRFPRQGHTSDVGIIESTKGFLLLKEQKVNNIVPGYLKKCMF